MNTRGFVVELVVFAIGATQMATAFGGQPGPAGNAALQYWKAFAVVPELSDEQDDALRKALEQGSIDQSLQKVIHSSQSALHELRKGAGLKECYWGISLDEGPHAILPHLSKARQLMWIACLRAESSFQQGQAAEATEDIVAVMTLARHIGRDAVLVCLLVDYAIERKAIETTAANLPSLDADQLQALAERLQALPAQSTVSQAVLMEKEMYAGWAVRVLARPDGKRQLIELFGGPDSEAGKSMRKYSRKEMITAAKQLQAFYDRIAEAVSLPPDEAKQAERRLMANPGIEGPTREMALGLVPAVGAARRVEAVYQTRLALLTAAIAVRQHGPDVLRKDTYRDPFGPGPMKYSKTNGGFKLQSTLTDRKDQPVSLTIGRP